MFTVYIIRSLSTYKHYIGWTENIQRRLYEHNHNNTQSIRNKGPFSILYTEEYYTKTEAIKRERQIKSYKGGNAFKRLIGL